MKTLLVLRHAKSSWAEESESDYDRPLNDRGKRDAPRVGEALKDRGIRPELVLSSSAKRARKTAVKVIEACGCEVELRLLDELYLAGPDVYVSKLTKVADEIACVMVVGHNPGLEELVGELTGRHHHVPTAAVFQIELPIDRWSELAPNRRANPVWSWQPRQEV